MMIPSKNLFDLIEDSEGCELTAYQDSKGVWTIGYGHTQGVHPGQVITQAVADQLLHLDVEYAVNCVNNHALPCTQGQFDALVDFVFNLGPSSLLTSHLLMYHRQGLYDKAAAEFPKWNHCNGQVLGGLTVRREKEQELYQS